MQGQFVVVPTLQLPPLLSSLSLSLSAAMQASKDTHTQENHLLITEFLTKMCIFFV